MSAMCTHIGSILQRHPSTSSIFSRQLSPFTSIPSATFASTSWFTAKNNSQPEWKKYHKPLTLQPVMPYKPRTVPVDIVRPPYARPEWASDPRHSQYELVGIEQKDSAGIQGMRKACEYASYIRAYAGSCVVVGRTTDEIDRMVHEEVCRLGIYPSPLGYAQFPKSLCSSVNQVVVHGIPDGRPLEEGDILNIDVSVYVPDGYHGDCSGMVSDTHPHRAHGRQDRESTIFCLYIRMGMVSYFSIATQMWPSEGTLLIILITNLIQKISAISAP